MPDTSWMDLSEYKNNLVADEEHVARIIFEPQVSEDKQNVLPSAFTLRDLRPPEDYISVNRIILLQPTRANTFYIREKKVKKYGYAKLNVGDIHLFNSLNTFALVRQYPSDDIPSHAGIHVFIGEQLCKGLGSTYSPGFIAIATYMAQISKPVAFSD